MQNLVRCILALTLCSFLSVTATAQNLTTTSLTDNISVISGAGANVVVAVGPDSVVVVDGGTRENAPALLEEIKSLAGDKPVTTLFNTSWRPEYVGLNYLLGESGTRIIGHENTRLWQTADVYIQWEDRFHEPLPAAAQVNESFYVKGDMLLGTERIEFGYIDKGHTDGDIYVHFVDSNILAVGGMLGVGEYPLMDYRTGGWIGGLRVATDGLIALADADTRVIASKGSVQNKAALQAQAEMLTTAYETVAEAYRRGRSFEDYSKLEPMAEFVGSYGDPQFFLKLLYEGIWYHIPGRAVPGTI